MNNQTDNISSSPYTTHKQQNNDYSALRKT